ncbi:MAG: c-type cytochrome [Chloroflexi bacterium]|nr:c-type cytochrome [Chloroflexota bacterium]
MLLIAALMLAACGTVATPEWSEEAQGTQAALAATADQQTASAPTATPTSTFTATPQPTTPPTATTVPPTVAPTTESPTATAVPPTDAPSAANAQSVPEGDPANGEALFNEMQAAAGFACSTCHFPNQEAQLIGPGLLNISTRAETHVPGQSAYDYIHTSIVDPSAYVVEGFPDNLMPKIYGQIFTEEQINDIIAYLFTLK